MRKAKHSVSNNAPAPVRHRLAELFWTLSPGFTRWAESLMDKQGITPQRMRLMALLIEHGPMKMGKIRDELGTTATNVTALVDALEREKMVARKRHPTDRRTILIELTPKAEKQIEENCPVFKDKVSALFGVFSKSEQEQLCKLLLKMREELVRKKILKDSDWCS